MPFVLYPVSRNNQACSEKYRYVQHWWRAIKSSRRTEAIKLKTAKRATNQWRQNNVFTWYDLHQVRYVTMNLVLCHNTHWKITCEVSWRLVENWLQNKEKCSKWHDDRARRTEKYLFSLTNSMNIAAIKFPFCSLLVGGALTCMCQISR